MSDSDMFEFVDKHEHELIQKNEEQTQPLESDEILEKITDIGLSLEEVHALKITASGLSYLKRVHTDNLTSCEKITDNGLSYLKGVGTVNSSDFDKTIDDKKSERMKKLFSISDDTRRKIVLFGFSGTIIMEIIMKKMEKPTPSFFLSKISNLTMSLFHNSGKIIFDIFDHIAKYISVKDIASAIFNLLRPIYSTVLSPYNMFSGIFDAAFKTSDSGYTIMTGVIISVVLMTLAEINLDKYKTSNILHYIKKNVIGKVYSSVGVFVADISSFYQILKLDKFVEKMRDIVKPSLEIIVAPVAKIIDGYKKELSKSKSAHVVIFGTASIIALGYYGYTKNFHLPKLSSCVYLTRD